MNFNKFGERLQSALKEKGISQQQLANMLGTTQQAISHWINGNRQPDLDMFIRVCMWLDEEPNYLLGFDEINKEEFFKAEAATNPLQKKFEQLNEQAFDIGAQLGEELGKIWLEMTKQKPKDDK